MPRLFIEFKKSFQNDLEPIRKVSNAYRKVAINLNVRASVPVLHIAYCKSYSR